MDTAVSITSTGVMIVSQYFLCSDISAPALGSLLFKVALEALIQTKSHKCAKKIYESKYPIPSE